MLVKVATLFLAGMVLLALFGMLRLRRGPRQGRLPRCPECGRFLVGRGPCACNRGQR